MQGGRHKSLMPRRLFTLKQSTSLPVHADRGATLISIAVKTASAAGAAVGVDTVGANTGLLDFHTVAMAVVWLPRRLRRPHIKHRETGETEVATTYIV